MQKLTRARHLSEFTSVDIEFGFLDYDEVMDILEQLVRNVSAEFNEKHKADLKEAGAKEISITKIDRLTYEQCIDELAKEGESWSLETICQILL